MVTHRIPTFHLQNSNHVPSRLLSLRLRGILLSGLLLAWPETSTAAFPGENGLIAFQSTFDVVAGPAIIVMHADGTGQITIANDAAYSAWSPDGLRIVFARREAFGPASLGLQPSQLNAVLAALDLRAERRAL